MQRDIILHKNCSQKQDCLIIKCIIQYILGLVQLEARASVKGNQQSKRQHKIITNIIFSLLTMENSKTTNVANCIMWYHLYHDHILQHYNMKCPLQQLNIIGKEQQHETNIMSIRMLKKIFNVCENMSKLAIRRQTKTTSY